MDAAPGLVGAQDNDLQLAQPGDVVLHFGTDVGVLNYAYVLEQLEAAFYIQVMEHPYTGMPAHERSVLTDIRDHEIAHRDFFRAALGKLRIPDLSPDFTRLNLADRSTVLETAREFEDFGVAAYNGAAKYLVNPTYLGVAGEIVSVEARHASAIRDLLQPKTGAFAPKAFDDAFDPKTVLAMAKSYTATKFVVVKPGGMLQ